MEVCTVEKPSPLIYHGHLWALVSCLIEPESRKDSSTTLFTIIKSWKLYNNDDISWSAYCRGQSESIKVVASSSDWQENIGLIER